MVIGKRAEGSKWPCVLRGLTECVLKYEPILTSSRRKLDTFRKPEVESVINVFRYRGTCGCSRWSVLQIYSRTLSIMQWPDTPYGVSKDVRLVGAYEQVLLCRAIDLYQSGCVKQRISFQCNNVTLSKQLLSALQHNFCTVDACNAPNDEYQDCKRGGCGQFHQFQLWWYNVNVNIIRIRLPAVKILQYLVSRGTGRLGWASLLM